MRWDISVEEVSSVRRVVRFSDTEVFYDFEGDIARPPVLNLDFAVVAVIFRAMKHKADIHVRGPVSTLLLRNVEQFQEVWSCWHRHVYTPVRVTADVELDEVAKPQERKGVFAFSGGVDGSFALLRHLHTQAGYRTAKPVCAVMIHGFDIPLTSTEAFTSAVTNARGALGALGVPLTTVRTNWRASCYNWESEFTAGLAACLHQFSIASVGVMGAGEDYAHLNLPWGSNPVTNPMLSGSGFEVLTEGGGYTRTERVDFISATPAMADNLRVCWEGPITGKNCGRCEKCIRTKLNFMAVGRRPLCFDRPPTTPEILGLPARHRVQLAYLVEILETAKNRCISGAWIEALEICVSQRKAEMIGPSDELYSASPSAAGARASDEIEQLDRLSNDLREAINHACVPRNIAIDALANTLGSLLIEASGNEEVLRRYLDSLRDAAVRTRRRRESNGSS